jgi:hypothetical protein
MTRIPPYPPISFRQTCTFQVFPSSASRLSSGPSAVQSVDHPQIQEMLREGLHDPAVSNQPRSRPINVYEMCYSMRRAHQEAADTSARGAARQKPGCVTVRHFCDWIVCCNAYKPELRMILLSQISSDQCPIDKYEMRTARGEWIRHLPTARRGRALLGRSQAASLSHFCNWIVCCNAYKPSNTSGASHDPAVSNQLRSMPN